MNFSLFDSVSGLSGRSSRSSSNCRAPIRFSCGSRGVAVDREGIGGSKGGYSNADERLQAISHMRLVPVDVAIGELVGARGDGFLPAGCKQTTDGISGIGEFSRREVPSIGHLHLSDATGETR